MGVKLIIMCGLQCSGKSTKAKQLAKEYDATLISSDNLREYYPNFDNGEIFKTLYMLMNIKLKNGTNVIIDATNTTAKTRRLLFRHIKVNCEKICYVMETPYEECIKRLKIRNMSNYPHKIKEEVILKYHKSFQMPSLDEGFDEIIKIK